MFEDNSFIESQFPVSKVSKESYKERKANNGQTLTGLGKWWGRKPLILVRAALIGCLMPASNNPKKDTEIFLKILSMDNEGLALRKERSIPTKSLYEIVKKSSRLSNKYLQYFTESSGSVRLNRNAPKSEIETAAFGELGYDEKLIYCKRPEHLENISDDDWNDINHHLGTSAHSIKELVRQLSEKRYLHNVKVGDCFCGGGSIPFEAARVGCNIYASDLNPIAGMLTWADINIAGTSAEKCSEILSFQQKVFDEVNLKIDELGIESNELGEKAVAYIYCVETKCPECGKKVPLAPSWVIGKGTKTVAKLVENKDGFDFEVKMNASSNELKEAEKGTVTSQGLVCPCCGLTTPISSLRHDSSDQSGAVVYGLRKWNKDEYVSREDDVYHEKLIAIKYESKNGNRYYRAPQARDIENENKVLDLVSSNFAMWQEKGLVPSSEIESGYNTDQLIRERGWKYWHQLFNARQLLLISTYIDTFTSLASNTTELVSAMLGIQKVCDYNSKLSSWNSSGANEKVEHTFYNQALNTMFVYGSRAAKTTATSWFYTINPYNIDSETEILLTDARNVETECDIWVTDPPYADAVNYHELSEFFLAWDKPIIQKAFPQWYTDSKRVLAVKGDEHFSQTMIEIYSNLTKHMPNNGMQVVMFTHSDPAVWAQLAIIMWRAGLKVTAAWNIATETDASGLKSGNYVKGTVLLVLRKQVGSETAFLDEINVDIRSEVKKQIASMQALDDKEEPNFSDPDYVLAAYAASLKVLTSYAEIEDLDLDYELNQAISNPSASKIVGIIENAKKVAYDCVIPLEFDSFLWRDLTNSEKFYIKGLESEKHGNYQIGTYQEFARGFSISGYSQLMSSERANTARLKTPFEMASRSMNDVPDFENSLMRSVFQAIYVGIKEDMNPNKALGFLKNDIQDYWDKREMIKHILSFLVDIKDITNMQPHWTESAEMADQLLALVTHDSI